jgi:hypothetical protein
MVKPVSRSRGAKKSYVVGAGSARQQRRRQYGKYAHLRGKPIMTPDGLGTVLGDSNKFRGSRKVVVRLEDKRVRHYSCYEISSLGSRLSLDTWAAY